MEGYKMIGVNKVGPYLQKENAINNCQFLVFIFAHFGDLQEILCLSK